MHSLKCLLIEVEENVMNQYFVYLDWFFSENKNVERQHLHWRVLPLQYPDSAHFELGQVEVQTAHFHFRIEVDQPVFVSLKKNRAKLGNLLDACVAPVAYLEKDVDVGRVVAGGSVQDEAVAAIGSRQAAVDVHQPQHLQRRVHVEKQTAALGFRHLVLLVVKVHLQPGLKIKRLNCVPRSGYG
jgi:hypothetical protein